MQVKKARTYSYKDVQHFFNLKIIKFSHYAHLFSRLYVFLVSQLGRRTQLPLNSHSFLVSYE